MVMFGHKRGDFFLALLHRVINYDKTHPGCLDNFMKTLDYVNNFGDSPSVGNGLQGYMMQGKSCNCIQGISDHDDELSFDMVAFRDEDCKGDSWFVVGCIFRVYDNDWSLHS